MRLLIDGTANDGTLQTITNFDKLKSGALRVYPPFVVFDFDRQVNTDGPFPNLWQALAARALREYLAQEVSK